MDRLAQERPAPRTASSDRQGKAAVGPRDHRQGRTDRHNSKCDRLNVILHAIQFDSNVRIVKVSMRGGESLNRAGFLEDREGAAKDVRC